MERVRGIADLPITPEGRGEISLWAKWFRARGGVDLIYHSSLIRDVETAKILQRSNRSADLVDLGHWLFPQDMGRLQGQTKDSAGPRLTRLTNLPTLAPPGGQSLADFAKQFLPSFWNVLRMSGGAKVALVTHGSNVKLVNSWILGGAKQDWSLGVGGLGIKIPTDCVFYTDPFDFLGDPLRPVFQSSTEQLRNGLYQIRHGRTPWSAEG